MAVVRGRQIDFREIPIVDLAAPPARLAAEMRHAGEHVGFVYAAGHGIDTVTLDGILALARTYFARPVARKMANDVARSPCFRGYVPMATKGSGVPVRLLEAFQIMREAGPAEPHVRAGNVMFGANQWPDDMPDLRARMLDYFARMENLAAQLRRAFALALDLAPDYFEPFFRQPLTQLRLLHYPHQPGPFAADKMGAADLMGVETHTDPGAFTILLPDAVGGLGVRNRRGEWIVAPPRPATFVVNIGDMMQHWTGGRFVSTPHRVINTAGVSRYSIPFFVNPDYEAVITPLSHSEPGGGRSKALDCGATVEAAYRAAWPLGPRDPG